MRSAMRWFLIVGCVGVAGCTGAHADAGSSSGPSCDPIRLRTLASELDVSSPDASAERVWPGLEAACPPAVLAVVSLTAAETRPPPPRVEWSCVIPSYTDETQALARRLAEQACPGWWALGDEHRVVQGAEPGRPLVERCELDRYDIVSRDELVAAGSSLAPFVLFDLLRSHHVDRPTARILARTLLRLEREMWGPLQLEVDGQLELAAMSGEPLFEQATLVTIGTDGIGFDGRSAGTLEAGRPVRPTANHVLADLFDAADMQRMKMEAMGRSDDAPRRALLAVDRHVPWGTTLEALHTLGRAGFDAFGFVVEPHPHVHRQIEVRLPVVPLPGDGAVARLDPPRRYFGDVAPVPGAGPDPSPVLTVEQHRTSISIGRGRHAAGAHTRIDAADLSTLAREAVKVSDGDDAHRVHLSAAPTLSTGEVLDAIWHARGGACLPGEACLPDVTLMLDSAHQSSEDDWAPGSLPAWPSVADPPPGLQHRRLRAAEKNFHQIARGCFLQHIQDGGTLPASTLTLDVELDPTGAVEFASVRDTEGWGPFEECVAGVVEGWTFPPGGEGDGSLAFSFVVD